MAKTVVGLMETREEAARVVRDLTEKCNCDRSDIGLAARGSQGEVTGGAGTTGDRTDEATSGALKGAGAGAALGGVLGLAAGAASLAIPGLGPIIAAGPIASALAGAGVGAVAGGLIGGLTKMGVPEEEAHYYAEGVRRGGTLITVHARNDDAASCAERIMQSHGAVDIENRASTWRQQGWGGRFSEEDQVLPVAEEQLAVGKRKVSQGRARIYSHVTETPVEETVQLREERARVERQRVDRPVQAGDSAFRERSVEVPESTEEPVVAKRGRVTEEVRVGKQSSQRQQTVRDTVRKSDVRVERERSAGGAGSAYRGPERRARTVAYSGTDRRRGA
jgi:uncharacterized protein (TIGR02271 family)